MMLDSLVVDKLCLVFLEHLGVESDELHVTAGGGVIVPPHLLPVPHRHPSNRLVDLHTNLANLCLQCLEVTNRCYILNSEGLYQIIWVQSHLKYKNCQSTSIYSSSAQLNSTVSFYYLMIMINNSIWERNLCLDSTNVLWRITDRSWSFIYW